MKSIMKKSDVSIPRPTSERKRRLRPSRKLVGLIVEFLEDRHLLAVAVMGPSNIPAPYWTPTDSNLYDAQNGPMANLGPDFVSIYQAYETGLASSTPSVTSTPAAVSTRVADGLAARFPSIQFNDGLVGIDVNSLGGDFNQFVSTLQSLGMQVTASSSTYGIAEGWVPIAELPTIAQLPQTEAGSPMYVPIAHAFQGFQGAAYNEGETSLMADAARSQYGLTGAGVTVGVLSDSVNQVGGGLQASYNTGDLNSATPVDVLQDGPTNSDDEGRAMLESIHDVAPGANLQFASAFNGELSFGQNIEALANAGSKLIVDDVSYFDEPFFQDGVIAQGVDYATSRGALYFSAAANSGTDQGYLSSFRPITATVGSGSSSMTGTFQNFNGGTGATSALLQVTTEESNALITFQYDQPYKTQEPAGATATVTSNMSFYVFNSSGALVTSGTANNVATQAPYQSVTIANSGTYYVAIKLVSGTAPGHVEFVGLYDAPELAVSQQYGSAGGTYYPSSTGHETAANTIGVGATPWWATTPFLGQSPLQNENYSSSGPGLIDLSPKGTPMVAQLTQNPAITAPDGNSTSFAFDLPANTTEYSPVTSYNFVPTGQTNNPLFFGTSEAAPNAAAVAALMLQENPALTRPQILQAMETTATPMNGTPAGTWNVQSGYGFVNALAAIAATAPASSLTTSTTAGSPSVVTPTVNTAFNLTGTVSGSGATPSGSVDFYDVSYNTDLGSVNLSGGQAVKSVIPTQLGAHVYLLTYSGDSTYAKSTAYVVLDVISSGHSFVLKPISSNSGASSSIGVLPLNEGTTTTASFPIPLSPTIATQSDSQSAGDLTVGNTATSATETDPLAKKRTI
jgi:large repetitive protein